MDSRDSALSVATDDDGVTASLAKEASALFQSEKFGECVQLLNRLMEKKKDDPKILHNIALAEFFRDGCSDPKRLIEILVNVKKKSEDFARASRDQADLTAQATSKTVSGAKGNALSVNGTAVLADEFDPSVAALNISTILFHLHEYPKALSVLEPLFQNIEPINETTAHHVCLLLLDAAFVTQDASKFSDVINYLEKAFGVCYMRNQVDSGSTAQQQASNFVAKSALIPNSSLASDDLKSEGITAQNSSDGSLSRTLSDDAMEYEDFISTLDISGQNISRPSNLPSSNDLSRTPTDRSTLAINLKLELPLYKIQFLILARNLKAAKREVKLAMNIARGVDSSRTLLLKSQLEYARGNYPKALKLVRASTSQGDVGSSIITNNNIGCIYYQQGKHSTSSIFFHRALSNCSSLWKEKPRKLSTFSQDKSLLIAYNCGLQNLACGKPILAARCFVKASLVFYNRPLIWLRLAECCLMALEKGLLKPTDASTNESEFKVQVIGQGKWRHLAAQTGCLKGVNENSNKKDNSLVHSIVTPTLSMSFARQCLLNALHLLGNYESKHVKSGLSTSSFPEENESSEGASSKTGHKNLSNSEPKSKDLASSGQVNANGDAKEHEGGPYANSAATNTMSEYEEIRRRENLKIKQAVLIDLAFVELELGNPVRALCTAVSLLNLPECPRTYTFLGHVYAAEALCLLDRPKEAAEHLSNYLHRGMTVELPYTEEDWRMSQVKKTTDSEDMNTPTQTEQQDNTFLSPVEARQALYVNLASLYAMQGELEQASRFASQALAAAPDRQQVALMAVYLDLKLGKTQQALTKLKRFCRLRFLPLSSVSS